MWGGSFSPDMVKKLTKDDVAYDPENTDDPTSMPPEEVIGTLRVKLGGQWYSWPSVTYEQYLQFQAAGFSRAWLNANLPIHYIGDWGWPWGRQAPVKKKPGFFTI